MSKDQLIKKIMALNDDMYDYVATHDDDAFDDLMSTCNDIIDTQS